MKPPFIRFQNPIELQILDNWCQPIAYQDFAECLTDAVLQQIRLKVQGRILRLPMSAKFSGKIRLSQAEAYALWHRVAHIYKPDRGYELSLFNQQITPLHQYMLTNEINQRYGS
ncbi:MAG: hypothetical protein ACK5XN_31140 [Bacteroidota bacterium]|jgi:hypothetical protein